MRGHRPATNVNLDLVGRSLADALSACEQQPTRQVNWRGTRWDYSWPPRYVFSPAFTANGSRFSFGGNGHAANDVNTHGGFSARLKSSTILVSPAFGRFT